MNKDKIKDICKKNHIINLIISFVYRILGRSYYLQINNNRVYAKEAFLWGVKFNINGKNNKIILKKGVRLKKTKINIYGDNNILVLDEFARVHNSTFVLHQDECCISLGKYTSAESVLFAAVEQKSKILIGDDCMFSTDIEIRTSDSHKIYDLQGKRINYNKDIIIGNHVWIGAHANILKGVHIEDGSIVGFGSLVTKDIPEKVIVAGIPAKIVKQHINWER